MSCSSFFSRLPGAAWLAALLSAALLGGCSTLSKEDCVRGDWQHYGYYDGTQGYPPGRIEEHRQACAEFRVTPNPVEYARGREMGLLEYCTPMNGYNQGKSGATYHYVCRPDREAGFLRNYHLGRQIHEMSEKIRRIESQIRDKEKELEKDKDNSKKLNEEQRRHIRERIHDLEREKNTLKGMRQGVEVMVYY
ncbi:MAG: DUF2799 domain-containing protein [Sulfuricella sp.]|nr:DUF2799 domain-containing protein [Sulfuricella sp.]